MLLLPAIAMDNQKLSIVKNTSILSCPRPVCLASLGRTLVDVSYNGIFDGNRE
jgi:hypothetical protein